LIDDDYIYEQQYITNQSSYQSEYLELVIAPTNDCNFRCFYCFEEGKKAEVMDAETIDALFKFIYQHTEVKRLNITWYGGEPLLAFDVIKTILNRLKSDSKIQLEDHTIVTNGYLFNKDVVEFFKTFPLNSIQITLDGNKERHDKIRCVRHTKTPTYDAILNNIDLITTELPNTHVNIRVNIEKKNAADYEQIKKMVATRWEGKNIRVYPGILRIDNETKTALSCDSLSRAEAAELVYKTNNHIESLYPKLQLRKICSATVSNSYIVDANEYLFKCWNDLTDSKRAIGNIKTGELKNPSLLFRYLQASKWYNREECKKCFFLPICGGGCAYYVLRNMFENGEYDICDCMHKSPDMLNKCLEYYYENQKN